jgi:hypothetical protein
MTQQVPAAQQPAVDSSTALMQQMLAQGASQNAAMLAAMQQLESQGVNSQAPAVQQQLQAAAVPATGLLGLSNNTLLLLGGAALAAYLLLKEGK